MSLCRRAGLASGEFAGFLQGSLAGWEIPTFSDKYITLQPTPPKSNHPATRLPTASAGTTLGGEQKKALSQKT
jgi:hypothetical protein